MLPFLKKNQDAAMMGEDEPTKRKSDDEDESEYTDFLDALSEDFLEAVAKKDKVLLKSTLDAFCEYVREMIHAY